MGFLDDAIGGVLNNLGQAGNAPSGDGNPVLGMIMELIRQHGGLGGLVDTLVRNGLGPQAASWVGSGSNEPINPEQIGKALDSGELATLATRFGIDANTINELLAKYLPQAVNQLTPNGRLPSADEGNALLENGLATLAGKLFS